MTNPDDGPLRARASGTVSIIIALAFVQASAVTWPGNPRASDGFLAGAVPFIAVAAAIAVYAGARARKEHEEHR